MSRRFWDRVTAAAVFVMLLAALWLLVLHPPMTAVPRPPVHVTVHWSAV